ncbi:MAG: hypothetical protein WBB28_19530 [Crinalium sp.]
MDFIVSIIAALIAVLVYSNRLGITTERNRSSLSAIALLIAVIGTLYSLSKALIIIPTGNIGVVDAFGQVSQRYLAPGVHRGIRERGSHAFLNRGGSGHERIYSQSRSCAHCSIISLILIFLFLDILVNFCHVVSVKSTVCLFLRSSYKTGVSLTLFLPLPVDIC